MSTSIQVPARQSGSRLVVTEPFPYDDAYQTRIRESFELLKNKVARFDCRLDAFRDAIKAIAEKVSCEDCGHTAKLHNDPYGCEHESGDRDGVAMPPCHCQGDAGVKAILEAMEL